MFSLISAWANGWANNWDAGDSRRHRVHYDISAVIGGEATPKSISKYITWVDGEHKMLPELNKAQKICVHIVWDVSSGIMNIFYHPKTATITMEFVDK